MAIYSKTLDELVEMTCRLVNDWVEGTATGGSATTVADTSRLEEDDYFNSKGGYVYFRTGTYAGSWRKITAFVQSGGVNTFAPAVGGDIVAGDNYAILAEFSWADVVSKINLAIDMVAEEALVWAIDETSITLVDDQFEYSLPTTFMFIHRLTMADSNGNFYGSPIPPDHYKIIHGAGTPKIHFYEFPKDAQYDGHWYGALWAGSDFTAGRALRIEGLGAPAILPTDTSTCAISPAYVTFQAAALLHASRIRRPDNEPDDHRVQAEVWQARADIARVKVVSTQLPPNSKRVRE